MSTKLHIDRYPHPGMRTNALIIAAIVAFAAALVSANAQASERNGKEVVEKVCGACHTTGVDGAPKIGDKKAWGKRASQGLTSLTKNAIHGIRKMPPHGGDLNVTDLEIGRAITYMVNQSGGRWIEPADTTVALAERSGEQIVKAQCSKCHQSGASGAPKIGDREAWIPRLKQGFEGVVRSAIKGHGAMPARGGVADLSDEEMRSAITYMFNPGSAKPRQQSVAAAAQPDPNHKVIGGTEIHLGIVAAQSIRAMVTGQESRMHGGVPKGAGYYHVNISLFDANTKVPVTDAQVEVRVDDAALRAETRPLELMGINNTISYGNYFRMPSKGHYAITVQIRRPGTPAPIEVRFDFNV